MKIDNISLDPSEPLLNYDSDQNSKDLDYQEDENRPKSSFFQILIHLFKSNLGVGLLNMPQNMSKAGIVLGPIMSLMVMLPIIHCMLLLLKCSREIKKRTGKRIIGYAGTFRYALIEHIHSHSRYCVYLVNFFLVTAQLGVCSVYITFSAQTLYEVTEKYLPDIRYYMIIIGAVILPLVLVSRLDIMSILSGSANVLCAFGLCSTIFYIIRDIDGVKGYSLTGDLTKFPLFISSLLYVYEGINVVVPLDNEIDNPSLYPLALKIATYCCGLIYFTIGLLGYIAYGNHAKSSVTFNLPIGPFTNTIKIIYAIAVILSFFLQFHIAVNVMLPTILKIIAKPNKNKLISIIIRLFFAFIVILFAIIVPQLNNLISLIGALSCASMSLIFPCIIHLATFWNSSDENKLRTFDYIKDIFLIFFGTIMMVTGVVSSVCEIVVNYNKN